MSRRWSVLVVEDDPTVASVHCRFVAAVADLAVVGVARTAAEARARVETAEPDLVLLDLGLPGPSGLAFLRWLRASDRPTEVIAITAASSGQAVRSLLRLGVLDHLVKPFTPERLLAALEAFCRSMELLGPDGSPQALAQVTIDAVRAGPPRRELPEDLSPERLDAVDAVICEAREPLSAEGVGARLGIARVTARRYLEHLAATGRVTVTTVASGPGRPRKTYLAWPSEAIADRRRDD